ncbi:MAG TPA: M67 family metallopeptidase [Gammaproteobacteria bacterium]|nr:M67 family metallopeptidase [Gammaproteobacteria bacterium]
MNADRFPGPARARAGKAPARLTIRLPRALRDSIVAHCLAQQPLEGCGLLLGERHGRAAHIHEALPAPNVLASPHRYEIAPETVLAADRAARASSRTLLGAWHSHPRGAAVPSATDRAEAWPDWCYLIVGLAAPQAPELRAWRVLGEDFVEDGLEIT